MDQETLTLLYDIARREKTTAQIIEEYGYAREDLQEIVELHRDKLVQIRDKLDKEAIQEEEEGDYSELWIAKKSARLKRYQNTVDKMLDVRNYHTDTVALREIRSYMRYAAEELGQLMNRGAGMADDDTQVRYDISGVDMEAMH